MNHDPGRHDDTPEPDLAPDLPYGTGQGDHPGEPAPDPDERDADGGDGNRRDR